MQLSFDIFNQKFTHQLEPRPQPDRKISVGDIVSLMNKITFLHEFHIVLHIDNDYMQTIFKGACQLTKGNKRTELYNLKGLSNLPFGMGFENESFAVVKTDQKNPSAEWLKAGLFTQMTRHSY